MENRRRERLVILPDMIAQATVEKEFFARKTSIEFQQSASFAEELGIGMQCTPRSGSLLPFICAEYREDGLMNSAALLYGHADMEMDKEILMRGVWRTRPAQNENTTPDATKKPAHSPATGKRVAAMPVLSALKSSSWSKASRKNLNGTIWMPCLSMLLPLTEMAKRLAQDACFRLGIWEEWRSGKRHAGEG